MWTLCVCVGHNAIFLLQFHDLHSRTRWWHIERFSMNCASAVAVCFVSWHCAVCLRLPFQIYVWIFFSLRSRSSRSLYINYNIIVVRGMFIVWTQRQYPQILNVSLIVWNCVVRLLKGHRHRIVVWWWWTENEWRGMRKKRLQSIVTNAQQCLCLRCRDLPVASFVFSQHYTDTNTYHVFNAQTNDQWATL